MKTDEIAAELVRMGKLEEARLRLAGLAAENHSSVDWNDLGAVQFALHDFAEAEVSFRRALELDTGNAQAGANLGALLVQTGRGAEAVPLFERALPHLEGEERAVVARMLQQCRPAKPEVAAESDAVPLQTVLLSLQNLLEKQAQVVNSLADRLLALEREVGRRRAPAKPAPERHPKMDLLACVDQFLEYAIANPDTRLDAWNYLNQRIWAFLHRLPDDFSTDSPYLQVARQWMQVFARCFVAGDTPAANWRIEQARHALQPFAVELGLNLVSASENATVPPSSASDEVLPDLNEEFQSRLLSAFSFAYRDELETIPLRPEASGGYFLRNGIYEGADGDSLYCMIRHFKPRQIVHFGSANSILLATRAMAKNRELDPRCECDLIAIDPFPNALLQTGVPGLSECIRIRMRDVSPADLMLDGNSILFVDSDLALREPEDVAHLFESVLPGLPAGVWIHLHDVYWSNGKRVIGIAGRRHTEQVSAFLARSNAFEIMLDLGRLHRSGSVLAREAFPHMEGEGGLPPTAFWMRTRR